MRKDKNKFAPSPKKDEHFSWKVTDAMKEETFDGMLNEEMEETISAVVLAETYPDLLDYENLGEREK